LCLPRCARVQRSQSLTDYRKRRLAHNPRPLLVESVCEQLLKVISHASQTAIPQRRLKIPSHVTERTKWNALTCVTIRCGRTQRAKRLTATRKAKNGVRETNGDTARHTSRTNQRCSRRGLACNSKRLATVRLAIDPQPTLLSGLLSHAFR
jgi:hypothetical protein